MNTFSKLNIMTSTVLMRPHGDWRPDYEVKEELLNKHMSKLNEYDKDLIMKSSEAFDDLITSHNIFKHEVSFILEDRQSVVDHWRSLGYTCLQVAPGNF